MSEDFDPKAFLDELGINDLTETEDEEVEDDEDYEVVDKDARAVLKKHNEILSKHLVKEQEDKAARMIDSFMETATENEKFAFNLIANGDESADKLKKIIEAAKQKGKALDDRLSSSNEKDAQEIDALAGERARQIAADEWGAGPIAPGKSTAGDDEYKKLMERNAAGDIDAFVALTFTPPPRPGR